MRCWRSRRGRQRIWRGYQRLAHRRRSGCDILQSGHGPCPCRNRRTWARRDHRSQSPQIDPDDHRPGRAHHGAGAAESALCDFTGAWWSSCIGGHIVFDLKPEQEKYMKWITREHVKVDRVAWPWLIKKVVDKDAEVNFVPADKVMAEAKRLDATPYDVKDVELGHHGKECSFEAILKKYKLTEDPALVLLGRIVNGADTDNTLYHQPEGPELEAVAQGFRQLGFNDEHAQNAAEWIVYDALYAYCPEMEKRGKPHGDFMS